MAVTYAQFVQRFPEFSQAPQDTVEACLAEAEARVDRTFVATNKADAAVKYLAAHLIAVNPLGEYARLDASGKKKSMTTYWAEYMRLIRSTGAGCRVI